MQKRITKTQKCATYKNARGHTFTHIHTNTQTHITDLLCVSCIRNKLNHPHRLLTKFALLQLLLQVLQRQVLFFSFRKYCIKRLQNYICNHRSSSGSSLTRSFTTTSATLGSVMLLLHSTNSTALPKKVKLTSFRSSFFFPNVWL